MKINWNPNPFLTTVELDHYDKTRILLAYQNEEYTNILCSLHMELEGKYTKQKLTDLEVIAKKVSKWGDICNLKIESEEIQDLIGYLDTPHMGDCTCVPCSCARCQVEEMLGIDTLGNLGKHSARKVEGSFGKDGNKTIDEAIASLEKIPEYIKPDTWPDQVGWDTHIPRWEKERESAVRWLKEYKEKHGF